MMVPAVRKRTPSILALMLVVEPLASGINAAMKRRAIISNRFSASEPRRRISTHSSVGMMPWRSEEHTSELQSLMRISYAVFCLEKKTHPPKRRAGDRKRARLKSNHKSAIQITDHTQKKIHQSALP